MKKITDLDELKSIELGIMKEVHKFCEDNSIKYCLSHGSLIGAVRHKGFIPWDDDIDLFMDRNNYNRFCELFPQKYKGCLSLVNHKTKPYFGRPMSKVIDTRTSLREPIYIGDDTIGVFIDIWPLDGMPSDANTRKKHVKEVRTHFSNLYNSISTMNIVQGRKNKLKHLWLQFVPHKLLVDKVDDVARKYSFDECEYVTCYIDPYCKQMRREWFEEVVLAPFEDCLFFIPKEYDKILRLLYGEYMKFPPAEKQVPHHIIDTYWK